MSKPTDAPPAYYAGGQGPEAPKPTYDGQQQQQQYPGGYPPQQQGGFYPPQDGGYYQQQNMGYGPGPQGPPYGGPPGPYGPQGPYDPNMPPPQQGQYPPGAYYGHPGQQYQDNRGQRGPGMLEGIMAALCCCCCLDILI